MSKQNVGRLAMRVEGGWWVAYYAKPDTMDDAIEMGRIRMGIVRGDEDRRETFKQLMISALEDFFEQIGQKPEIWDERPAPEDERSGNA